MIFAPKILILMGTPDEVLPNSTVYFQVYFAGSIFFVMYNIFVGILQAVGDSRHPLYYLIISSITNVILDLILVAGFRFGVGVSGPRHHNFPGIERRSLSPAALKKPRRSIGFPCKKIRLDFFMLRQIISNGLPAGLQNSIIALANVVVQSNINSFGKMAMAGCGSYSKVEGFAFLPVTCFALSMTTFTSQNIGAKKYDRVKKGARFGVLCSITLAELVGVVMFIFVPYTDFRLQPYAGSHPVWNHPGPDRRPLLFPAGLLPLCRRNPPWCREIHRPYDRHDGLLVRDPRHLHHHHRPLHSLHPSRLLGLSPDLDPELNRVSVLSL